MLSQRAASQEQIAGAWERKQGDSAWVMIAADGYFSIACHHATTGAFYYTYGGPGTVQKGNWNLKLEFHSAQPGIVGNQMNRSVKTGREALRIREGAGWQVWKQLDNGSGGLTGNWRITQRAQNGKMVPIHTTGPRKTIKILSAGRFQWAAINTATGEFSGTGGGRYTFENGVYTEHIEFFSRDNSRVGMSLSFEGRLDGKDWYHSGKSSKGDPIQEVWSR